MGDVETVDPFVVRSIEAHKPSSKDELAFKKGQLITVEKFDDDNGLYFGFFLVGKKVQQGWFPDYFTTKDAGSKPEQRPKAGARGTPKKGTPKKSPSDSGDKKANAKVDKKAAKLEAAKKAKEAKLKAKEDKKNLKSSKKSGAKKGKKGKKGDANKSLVPPIVSETIAYLREKDALKLEGIFRISGSITDVKTIQERYLAGKKVQLHKVHNPHTVAGVLKIYFRESKDPLLTFELYDCWVAAVSTPDHERADCIRKVVDLLPDVNAAILKEMMKLLNEVIQYESENRMSVNNVAIVFAPTLLRPPGDNIAAALQDSSHANHLIKFMVQRYEEVFEYVPPADGEGDDASKPDGDDGEFRQTLRRDANPPVRGRGRGAPRGQQGGNGRGRGRGRGRGAPPQLLPRVGVPAELELSTTESETVDSVTDDMRTTDEELSSSLAESTSEEEEESSSSRESLSFDDMMDLILEGKVNEVDAYLDTLGAKQAAETKKELLRKIDEMMASDDFQDL